MGPAIAEDWRDFRPARRRADVRGAGARATARKAVVRGRPDRRPGSGPHRTGRLRSLREGRPEPPARRISYGVCARPGTGSLGQRSARRVVRTKSEHTTAPSLSRISRRDRSRRPGNLGSAALTCPRSSSPSIVAHRLSANVKVYWPNARASTSTTAPTRPGPVGIKPNRGPHHVLTQRSQERARPAGKRRSPCMMTLGQPAAHDRRQRKSINQRLRAVRATGVPPQGRRRSAPGTDRRSQQRRLAPELPVRPATSTACSSDCSGCCDDHPTEHRD
jgi:hypothetical protein